MTREVAIKRKLWQFVIALAAVVGLTPITLYSSPITSTAIGGSWELKTVCTNENGKAGACIEMKRGSLLFTFGPDGNWDMEANDQNKTKKSGSYEISKGTLILKNANGSRYQDWRTDFSDDGQSFALITKQLIETFVRVTTNEKASE